MDFENLKEAGIPHYLQFLRELTSAAHAQNLVVSVDTPVPQAYTMYYQRGEQARFVDYMIVMAYDEHFAGSEEEWNAIPAQECGLDADERALLQGALARLADEERRIVLLHAVTGMKHREIAALLELPLPTVLSKYHRALKKMRIFLEGDDAR